MSLNLQEKCNGVTKTAAVIKAGGQRSAHILKTLIHSFLDIEPQETAWQTHQVLECRETQRLLDLLYTSTPAPL